MCGCVSLSVFTYTHIPCTWARFSDVGPGVGTRNLKGLKNPDGLNLGIYVYVFVYSLCTKYIRVSISYIAAGRWNEILK